MAHRSKAADRLQISPGAGGTQTKAIGLDAEIDSQIALRAANSNCTILLTGETGVGKGFLARWLHEHSQRAGGPFIPINCGAIPETLVDSQLFGHARGAFSGAVQEHLGLIRAAEHGTLLLDEISELPPSAQNRLLRLLQDREVQPVGHSRPVTVDVRIFAATNIDLNAAAAQGRFREDLLFRLDVIQLRVKPLRERFDEMPELLSRFIEEFAELYQTPLLQLDADALNMLTTYHWPGNIRQLRTLIERLYVLCPTKLISVEQLLEFGQLHPCPLIRNGLANVERIKIDQVRRVLSDSGGSITHTADVFGVHRSTIYRWLRGH
jgi:transcriptional regulator with PAS, ATPase and Fis domain